MSESGDVVWSDGRAWIRGTTAYGDHKAWWCHPLPGSRELYRRLSEAEQADDFAWLVKDGIPIVLNALAVYQALDSFADFVAKRDADAELTAERDALLSRLADVRAELEPWGLERLARRDRTLAEQVHDIRQSWTALRDANRHNVSRADAAEQQLATAHAEHEKLLTDWARAREERDQALRGLADLQRLVAAAEANEPVLVHPDWRQAEIDELTAQRDAARKDAQEAVAEHKKLVDHYAADFPRRAADNKELRELRQTCSDLRAENEALSQELAKEERVCKEIQRDLDYRNNVHEELRRQFDVAVNDRNILRARCDELERDDRHSCGFKCGQQEERRAVVAWLNKNPQGWARQWSLAGRIERGEHDV